MLFVPNVSGNWNNTANAGVFYRNFNNNRTNSNNNYSFRSSDYFSTYVIYYIKIFYILLYILSFIKQINKDSINTLSIEYNKYNNKREIGIVFPDYVEICKGGH